MKTIAMDKMTTVDACRKAGISRERFNEHVANGHFPCAPATVPGRARFFDPDDMVALWLFSDLLESDNISAAKAGQIACAMAAAAKENRDAAVISYVETYAGSASAHPASDVPSPDEWDRVTFSGSEIRKVTTFNIALIRTLIAPRGTLPDCSAVLTPERRPPRGPAPTLKEDRDA